VGLFEDDFYSTKVTTRREARLPFVERKTFRSWSSGSTAWLKREKLLAVVLASSLVGSLLTATAFLVLRSDSPEVMPVQVSTMSKSYEKAQDPVVRVADQVLPTVVSIISSKGEQERAGGSSPGVIGLGSGVIFQKSGSKARIVTNHHVVEHAEQMDVVLASGERMKAKLVGKDAITDLAVLEVEAGGIERVAEFGDSDQLKPGEPAIAIGNPLGLGFSQSITTGVISSAHRKIPISFNNDGMFDWEFDVIQTDAAINEGNSGGALVDLNGKVIGINSMKISETGVEGLGFAIPINQVKETISSLVEHGKVKRPFIGVTTVSLDPTMNGVSVLKLPEHVKTGLIVLETVAPAAEAGLTTNDVIVELDGQSVGSTLELRKYLYEHKRIGDKLKVTYYRNGKKMITTLTLAESQKG
jgi:serine protease Do